MLQIPTHPCLQPSISYAALAGQYLPEIDYPPTLPTAAQQAMLQQQNAEINNERFYTITDVKTGAIMGSNGIRRWLGHTDAHFTQKKYLQIIHPAHAVVQGFYAAVCFDMLMAGQMHTNPAKPMAAATLALKNKQGTYVYCKRLSWPFLTNAQQQLLAYLCSFTVIKTFANEDYFFNQHDDSNYPLVIKEQMKKGLAKLFETQSGFSVQELRIVKRYASHPSINSQAIAQAFKIEKATVDTYNKRILKKTSNYYSQSFENAKQAAAYFKRLHFI